MLTLVAGRSMLQHMIEYILASEGGEKSMHRERESKSVSDLDNDPMGQKLFLRLEAQPTVTKEVD